MRTFIIKARKGTTRWDRVRSQIGGREHFEVVAHSVMNAFFVSNDFRHDVEMYIVLDSSQDFPHTIKLTSRDGLSIKGFHEAAVVELVENALKASRGLNKDETRIVDAGVQVSGFGFEKLVGELMKSRPVYLLHPKGSDIRDTQLEANPIFVLSDHLALPKKTVSGLQRKGLKTLSLGKNMLFASQCIVLLNDEIDRTG